jgi:hypothetical protein
VDKYKPLHFGTDVARPYDANRFGRSASLRRLNGLPSWPAASIFLLSVLGEFIQPELITALILYLLLLATIVWATSHKGFDKYLFNAIAPFVSIVAIGLVVGIGADRYLYWKDAWYVSNPALILCVGFVLFYAMPDVARGMRALVIAGAVFALYFLFQFAAHPEILAESAVAIRESIGYGYGEPVIALTILFAYWGNWQKGLRMPSWMASFCLITCLMATALSFSRTGVICTIIGALAATGTFAKHEVRRIAVIVVVGLSLVMILNLSMDSSSATSQRSFVGKIARSLTEMNVHEYWDLKSINENWRGFETARALKMYRSGSKWHLFFGHGFGAQVDIGLWMQLGNPQDRGRGFVRYITFLHNGYALLLVRGGAVAVCLFICFILWMYAVGRRVVSTEVSRIRAAPARILQAFAITLALVTWLVGGVFNRGGNVEFLLATGFLLATLSSYQSDGTIGTKRNCPQTNPMASPKHNQ